MNDRDPTTLTTPSDLSPEKKLTIALELHEFGVEMMRQNIRRREPDLSDEEVSERLRAWLQDHPLLGVPIEQFDASGRAYI